MEKQKLSVKDSSLAFIAGFFLMQLTVVIFYYLMISLFSIFGWNTDIIVNYSSNPYLYLLFTIVMDAVLVGIFIFYKKRRKFTTISSKISSKKVLFYILVGILMFFCLYPVVASVNQLLVKWGVSLSTIPYELDTPAYLISILSLVIIPAVCEELLFRGIIFCGLDAGGKTFKVVLSSVMFMLFHMSLTQTVYPILAGIVLGIIMLYENNIIYTMIVHMVNNFLSLTLSYLGIELFCSHWLYYLLAVVLFFCYVGLIIYLIKKAPTIEKLAFNFDDRFFFGLSMTIMAIIWLAVVIYS